MPEPASRKQRWISRREFTATVLTHQADAGLASDLEELAGEMTGARTSRDRDRPV